MGYSNRVLTMVIIAVPGFSDRASAHAHLEVSVPADKATVMVSPSGLGMRFSGALNLRVSGVAISGPGNAKLATGSATVSDDGKTLVMPLPAMLRASAYVVDWHMLSIAGHKVTGRYCLAVKP
jgi:methionine-rich copper-binding protein CopC